MAQAQPPYFENDLTPVELSESSLQSVLETIKDSIQQALQMIESYLGQIQNDQKSRGTIFNGDLGIDLDIKLHIHAEKQMQESFIH